MTRNEINFLDEKDKLIKEPKKKKKFTMGKIIIYLLIIFVILGISFSVDIISSSENLSQTFGNLSLWSQIKHLISSDDKELDGETADRINVLLLGIGGIEHEGPYLTDTIIVASFKPSINQVALISIPRDLLVNIPGYGWRKVNHANAFGEAKMPGQGGKLAQTVISQTLNIPIHYYVRIDFDGFIRVIDDLGGITLEVENTLDDEQYPIKGKETATTTERYEHLYLEKGRHHFDGELALKYVRSRQAKGIEGSDFARSQRQQKILMAVKDKVLTFSVLANPYKISRVMDTLSQHLATNLQVWQVLRLFDLGKGVAEEDIINRVFDDSPDSVLYSSLTQDGAFVLQPKAGNFSELQTIVQNIFDPNAVVQPQPKKIEIQNGTKITGLAYRTAQYLESLGYQVIKIGNAPTQDYQKTVIYDLGPTDEAATNLTQLLNAELAPVLPEWVTSTTSPKINSQTDILIILGQDRANL